MKLTLQSSSFFSSAIRQDLRPVIVLSGQAFVISGCARTGRGQRSSQPANDISSEIQAVGQTEPVCRIETFGAAGGAQALTDEIIESYGLATRARRSATTARKTATAARNSATTARKTATAARGSATAARNSATTARVSKRAARRPATPARRSATPARRLATAARNSATTARKTATAARKAATGAVRVTTKAGSGGYDARGRETLIKTSAVRGYALPTAVAGSLSGSSSVKANNEVTSNNNPQFVLA
jgi:hypothetical protein